MTPPMTEAEERRLIDHWANLPERVAVNSNDIQSVKEDIHQIREDIKGLRQESREDSRTTRQAIIAFATAVSIPILVAAVKLAFFAG